MRALVTFLARRLARALVALWLVSTVVFVVMRLSGDPAPLLLPPDAPRSEVFRVRAELGLDRPLPVQYAVFLGRVAEGDFGRSIHFRESAWGVVVDRLPATLELGLTAFLAAVAVALPIGVLSAVRRNSALDQAAMAVALVGQSAPTFFIGIVLILLRESFVFFQQVSIWSFLTDTQWTPLFADAHYGILPLLSGTLVS